jgi:hypothetical protein
MQELPTSQAAAPVDQDGEACDGGHRDVRTTRHRGPRYLNGMNSRLRADRYHAVRFETVGHRASEWTAARVSPAPIWGAADPAEYINRQRDSDARLARALSASSPQTR